MNNRRHVPQVETTSASAVHDRMGRPLRDLRLSLTDECNFRCTYCMPEELFGEGHPFLAPRDLLSFDEILHVVRTLTTLGVRKVKITGGEPLLRPGVHTLIRDLWNIPDLEDVGLITNGYHLPRLAPRLVDAGLRRVTVSLDSIVPETFDRIVGRGGGLPRVLDGIRSARDAGLHPVKVNMVVQRGVNDHEVLQMASFCRDEGVELRFIEYMDVGRRNEFQHSLLVPNREILETVQRRYPMEPTDPAYYGEVADTYAYTDGGGRVGFISSMTQPFCGTCTRLRLAADGKLYRCLFSGIGLDTRAILRGATDGDRPAVAGVGTSTSEAETVRDGRGDQEERLDHLRRAVCRFWGVREDRYSELRGVGAPHDGSRRSQRVEMYRMGG